MIPSFALGARAAALVPTGGALLAAIAGGVAVGAMPIGLLERLVWTSGVATLLPAAQPPLGLTARVLLAVGAALVAGAVVWSALFLLVGPEGLFGPRARSVAGGRNAARRTGKVRRGDAHPDAPTPRPMTAADLGTPLMEVTAPRVQQLPADLDQPLAAFDPAALPETPREPIRPVAPLAAAQWGAGERIETFELERPTPTAIVAAEAPPPRKAAAPAPTIDALLRRLEESAGRRVAVR